MAFAAADFFLGGGGFVSDNFLVEETQEVLSGLTENDVSTATLSS